VGRPHGAEAAALAHRFGQNLILARRRVCLSQVATAERAGLDRTEISLLERGKRVPRLDTVIKLGGAVEVQPCVLLEGMAWELDRLKGRSS
jgi:transcriptional regulator with XRE-family HTH domain